MRLRAALALLGPALVTSAPVQGSEQHSLHASAPRRTLGAGGRRDERSVLVKAGGHSARLSDFIERASCATAGSTTTPLPRLGLVAYYKNNDLFYTEVPPANISDQLQVVECHNAQEDGEIWYTLRIDGFATTGNTSWTEIELLSDKGAFAGLLDAKRNAKQRGAELAITASFGVPLDAADQRTPLGVPPLHIHHKYLITMAGDWDIEPGSTLFMTTGDNECSEPYREPLDCNARVFSPQYCRPMPTQFYLNADVNDVRPAGSPPLEWSMLFGLRTREITSRDGSLLGSAQGNCTALSWLQLSQPADQLSRFPNLRHSAVPNVYFVPVAHDAFIMYWYAMAYSGVMADISWLHSHSVAFQGAMLLTGLPHDIGIRRDLLSPVGQKCIPKRTSASGFADNQALAEYVEQLARTQPSGSNVRLVSRAKGMVQRVDGIVADLKADVHLVRDWHFRKGDFVTMLAFSGPNKYGPATSSTSLKVDGLFGMHVDWEIFYTADDGEYHDAITPSASQYANASASCTVYASENIYDAGGYHLP